MTPPFDNNKRQSQYVITTVSNRQEGQAHGAYRTFKSHLTSADEQLRKDSLAYTVSDSKTAEQLGGPSRTVSPSKALVTSAPNLQIASSKMLEKARQAQ